MFGVCITRATSNFYNVIGDNLDQIISVFWSPRNPATIKFRIIPIQLYSINMLRFGILILDNHNDACDRGGMISFRRPDGSLIQWNVVTYGNIGTEYHSPLSGYREFET